MTEKADLVEAEGMVHVVNMTMAEYTLCGDAFDLNSDERGYEWREPSRRTVDCPRCVTIVRSVRGLHTR
jgi:hypothetical protein